MSEAAVSLPEALLQLAPCGMAVVDQNGIVQWANQALGALLGIASGDLTGQAPDSLPTPVSRVFLSDDEVIALADDQGRQRWLQRQTRHGSGQSLLIVHDITEQQRLSDENQRLRRQVDELKLTDDLTGLPNKRSITQTLELQVSRSRRYHNPLSVVMVHIALDDAQLATVRGGVDPLVLGVSRFLRDRLRWVDQIGRWEDNIFVLVLPETEKGDAEALVEKIRQEQIGMLLPEPFDGVQPQLSFGIGCWQKGDDVRTLLRQVTQALME